MTSIELTERLSGRNLAVGTWTSPKGELHISLTRTGRYNKNIAIPAELVSIVCLALQNELAKERG